MQKLQHKFYKPLNQKRIDEAMNELKADGHEYVDIQTLGAEDKFMLIYKEKDKTEAPIEDIQQYSNNPIYAEQKTYTSQKPYNPETYAKSKTNIIEMITENKIIILIVAGILLLLYFITM